MNGKEETFRRRIAGQRRFKAVCGALPLLVLGPLAWGISSLVGQLTGLGGPLWRLLLVCVGFLLAAFYGVGFLVGSFRLDGNVIGLLDRMDRAERRALVAVLGEMDKQ